MAPTKSDGRTSESSTANLALRGMEVDLVDCMVALPGQLFYSTQIPVYLWFLAKNKNADAKRGFRGRRLKMTSPSPHETPQEPRQRPRH